MDTHVYIDGFNLYYSLFRGRNNRKNLSLKWLDLEGLTSSVVKRKYSKNEFKAIKYYTAHVSGKEDPGKPIRQQAYLNALDHCCDNLSIHYGNFKVDEAYRATVNENGDLPNKVKVYLPEEKGSDVNLSSHMIWDAVREKYEVAVVLSNDTDLSEAFRIVNEEIGKKIILLQPSSLRKITAKSLRRYTFDTLYIERDDLMDNQLPLDIPNTSYHKPNLWKVD